MIKRFVAPNGREALARVRRELGEDALVLSTRRLAGGETEMLAAGPAAMRSLIEMQGEQPPPTADAVSLATTVKPSAGVAGGVQRPSSAAGTETFEQFLRRQAQRQTPTANPPSDRTGPTQPSAAIDAKSSAAPGVGAAVASGSTAAPPVVPPAVFRRRAESAPSAATDDCSDVAAEPAASPAAAVAVSSAAIAAPLGAAADARLLAELQSMRALLLEQMATMNTASSAADLQRRNPLQVRAMTRLLMAGFSPAMARHIAEHAPATTPAESDRWLADVLALNVRCADAQDEGLSRGGVYALVGPTGVGKTTTVAKLAARFAVRHGAQALGLITLDAFRVGAHEQLRAYGRILGTPVHLAQDGATLRDLLASMAGRRLVLIDTCGVSQRDQRLDEMLQMFEQAGGAERPIQRLLLLNAASHAETLDDVARAWQPRQCAGALLTKLDEAARIGGALDCVLRHKFTILGATNGQRVPEDWLVADSRALAQAALTPGQAAFRLAEGEAAVLTANATDPGVAVTL